MNDSDDKLKAVLCVQSMLGSAMRAIDDEMGQAGYAKQNPALLGSVLAAAATVYLANTVGPGLSEVSSAIGLG